MQRASVTSEEQQEEDSVKLSRGLGKLVLTLLETLRELMERQARRRIREGSLSEQETERLGHAFIQLNEKINEIAALFNLERKDLTLGLVKLDSQESDPALRGPQKNLLTLVDLLDRVVEKGVVVFGDVGISIAEVELINVQLRLAISAVKNPRKEREMIYLARKGKRRPRTISPSKAI